MNESTLRQEVRVAVQDILRVSYDEAPFSDEESLVLSRRLSSLQLVELATLFENQYGLDFAKIGFDTTAFDTINAMVALIVDAQP